MGYGMARCFPLSGDATCDSLSLAQGRAALLESLLAEKEAELKALCSSLREPSGNPLPEDGGLDGNTVGLARHGVYHHRPVCTSPDCVAEPAYLLLHARGHRG